MKWLLLIALIAQGFAVDIPKGFGNNLEIAELQGAKGQPIDRERLLLAEFYILDALGKLDQPPPKIIALHITKEFGDFMGMGRTLSRINRQTTAEDGSVLYNIFLREPNDYSYLYTVAGIYAAHFKLPDKEIDAAALVARKHLLATVNVKHLEGQK